MNYSTSPSPVVNKLPLPPLWKSNDPESGKDPVENIAAELVGTLFGGLPPSPQKLRFEKCCAAGLGKWPGSPKIWSYKIHCAGGELPFSFEVQIVFPNGDGPFPAIVNADGCWWYATEGVARMVLAQGCALVMFNRTQMARDWGGKYNEQPGWNERAGGLYDVYPEETFGAVSAWTWGIHRVVDLLTTLPFIDQDRIAVSGHSRGGKTALLAGCTDHRISLINDNASGAGGAALSRYVAEEGETLKAIVTQFPHWFGPEILKFTGKEEALPFDQHTLLACLAPRPVLLTFSLDDLWSNPPGMILAVEAAREVYKDVGVSDALAFHLREGLHAHLPEDWAVLLDFIGVHWQGKTPGYPYNQHPYGSIDSAGG